MQRQNRIRSHRQSAPVVPQSTAFCSEKIALVAEYGAAIGAYYAAIQELESGMITGSPEVYAKHRKATEDARMMCEVARRALDEHESRHRC